MPKCDVLLAAYNGTKYGPALLDSLLSQTCQDFRLLCRDDGSTDGTVEMLRQYAPKFEGRMQIIERGQPTGSAMGNFSILMEESEADYVLCADIDDVWLPHKIADTLDALERIEAQYSKQTPAYFFSDVIPVDANLGKIADSFWKFKKIDPAICRKLSKSLVCPPMLGCASGMNRALVRMAAPVPKTVTGHDWWALLVAAAFGQVRYDANPTMMYRIHGSNSSIPKKVDIWEYLRRANKFGFVRHGMKRRRDQAQAILERFESELDPATKKILADFVLIGSQNFLMRRLTLLRGDYLYPDLERNLATLIAI